MSWSALWRFTATCLDVASVINEALDDLKHNHGIHCLALRFQVKTERE